MMADPMWSPVGDEGLQFLSLDGLQSAKSVATAMAFGTLTAWSLLHLCSIPSALTPAAFVVMADGAPAIDDVHFLQTFHPSAANVAREWPSSYEATFPMDNNTLGYHIMTFFDKEVCLIFSCLFIVLMFCCSSMFMPPFGMTCPLRSVNSAECKSFKKLHSISLLVQSPSMSIHLLMHFAMASIY